MVIDQLEADLRAVLADQAATVPADAVERVSSRNYHPRSRRALVSMTSGATLVAAAAASIFAITVTRGAHTAPGASRDGSASGDGQHQTALGEENVVQLAGYTVALPTGYHHVNGATRSCSSELDLISGDRTRLISPISGSCPLVLRSVIMTLPAGARRQSILSAPATTTGAPGAVVFYTTVDAGSGTTAYFPAELAGGKTAYVSIGYGHSTINIQQAVELANGLSVTPTTPCRDSHGCG